MPNPRTKAYDTFVNLPCGAANQRDSYFRMGYQSNRESGQIVKRESPMDMLFFKYNRWDRKITALDAGNEYVSGQVGGWPMMSSVAYGRAYEAFKRAAEMPNAEFLLNIVQGRKSLEMIAARLFQARQIVSNLKKGRFGDAWEFMTMNPNATLKSLSRKPAGTFRFKNQKVREQMILDSQRWRQFQSDLGSLILEIRYGMQPLMQDIKAACDLLSKPIPDKPLKAVKTAKYSRSEVTVNPIHYVERVTIKGKIRVSNPNLDLANRMGMLNVAYVLWDAMPFSFLFDWLLPVGNFLKSLTDFAGLELIDASITGRISGVAPDRWGVCFTDDTFSATEINKSAYSITCIKMVRQVGMTSLPRPPLGASNGLSPGRALNALGLLLQQIRPSTARSTYG